MIEWDVLDEEQKDKLREPEAPQPVGIRWWQWLLLLLVIILAVIIWLEWQAQEHDKQIRADLNIILQEETRAQAAAFIDSATDLADPHVSQSWFGRYVDLFRKRYKLSNFPEIQEINWEDSKIITKIEWPQSAAPVDEQRAYRLVNNKWRRTSLPNSFIEPTEPKEELGTTYFMLRGAKEDLAKITDDSELRLNLEALRSRVVTYWPTTWKSFFLVLNLEPQELSPPVYFMDAQKLFINRYELVPFDPSSPLSAKGQYRLAVIRAVVEWLTTPDWMRDKEIQDAEEELPEEFTAGKDWIIMYRLLQDAEARHWALDGKQRRDIRNAWRKELAGEWNDPFTGSLPLKADLASPEEKQRWLLINLLIERQITIGGMGTIGRMATLAQDYTPEKFSRTDFFQRIAGDSTDNFEQIVSEYILVME